jgi:DNA-binding transcriptional MocR family regulator
VRANDNYVEWVRPHAGAICCVRLRKPTFDDTAVTRFYDAAAAKGARVAKGDWFSEEARVFRLGFGLLSMAELGDALGALTAALKETATAGGRC